MTSALDDEYAKRGLLRPSQAAQALGIDPDLVIKYTKAGQIQHERLEWKGRALYGWRLDDLEALRSKMARGPGS